MFIKITEKEIASGLVPLMDYREGDLKSHQILNWVKSSKVPVEEDEELINIKLGIIETKYRGIKPAFISTFYINRLKANQSDQLGSVVAGKLSNHVHKLTEKSCFLLSYAYPHLPEDLTKTICIWLPPATDMLPNEEEEAGENKTMLAGRTRELEDTFNNYLNRLKDFYMIIPRMVLSSRYSRRIRSLILTNTKYTVILKYGSSFNGVLLHISKSLENKLTDLHIPCYFHTCITRDRSIAAKEEYQNFFKDLARYFDNKLTETKWQLSTDEQKAVVSIKTESGLKVGDFVDLLYYNYKEAKPLNEIENAFMYESLLYGTSLPYAYEGESKIKNIRFDIHQLKKYDIILKARAALEPILPPEPATSIYLKNSYYILRFNENALKTSAKECQSKLDQICYSIKVFNKANKDELKCLSTANFALIRNIPLV